MINTELAQTLKGNFHSKRLERKTEVNSNVPTQTWQTNRCEFKKRKPSCFQPVIIFNTSDQQV